MNIRSTPTIYNSTFQQFTPEVALCDGVKLHDVSIFADDIKLDPFDVHGFFHSFDLLGRPRQSVWNRVYWWNPNFLQENNLKFLTDHQYDLIANKNWKLYLDYSSECRGIERIDIPKMLEAALPEELHKNTIYLTSNTNIQTVTTAQKIKALYVPKFQHFSNLICHRKKITRSKRKSFLFFNNRFKLHRGFTACHILNNDYLREHCDLSFFCKPKQAHIDGLELPDDLVKKFLDGLPYIIDESERTAKNRDCGIDEVITELNLLELKQGNLDLELAAQWHEKDVTKEYSENLFSLVGETDYCTRNDTELFYTEKTFKPMVYGHPILILGQKGLNKRLSELGFKTYEAVFDLSFDDEPDNKKRMLMMLKEIERVLRSLNKEDDIERFYEKIEPVVEHNRKFLVQGGYIKYLSVCNA